MKLQKIEATHKKGTILRDNLHRIHNWNIS